MIIFCFSALIEITNKLLFLQQNIKGDNFIQTHSPNIVTAMKSESQLNTYPLTNTNNPATSSSVPLDKLPLSGNSPDIQSSQISKNSSTLAPHHNALSAQRHQYILLQSQVRRLNKRIQIEQQIIKNKKLFEKIDKEIQNQQQKIKQKKRQIIKARLENSQASKKQRMQKQMQRDKAVAQIKAKQKRKQFLLKKILEKNKNQHQECYQNALLQRKMVFKNPINFQAIYSHEKKYLNSRNRYKTTFQEYQGEQYSENNAQQSKIRKMKQSGSQQKSLRSGDRQQSLSLRYKGDSKASRRKKDVKSSIQQYLETRRKQQKRIEQIKSLRQKSKQYGNKVQLQYHKNRAKTQSIQLQKQKQKQQAQQKQKQISQRNKILKNMKKPNIPQYFNQNIEQRKKNELDKVLRSNNSPEQKMKKLNMMSESELNQFQRKNRMEDLERLNQINMMRAELLLNLN